MSIKSLRVERALKKLGADLRDARKRRRITTQLMADRIGVTRVTLAKIERGDPNTSIGLYALAIHVIGKIDAFEDLVDRRNDPLGLDLMDQTLPKRVRVPK